MKHLHALVRVLPRLQGAAAAFTHISLELRLRALEMAAQGYRGVLWTREGFELGQVGSRATMMGRPLERLHFCK